MGGGKRIEGLVSFLVEAVSAHSDRPMGFLSEPEGVAGLSWGSAAVGSAVGEISVTALRRGGAVVVSRPGHRAEVHGVRASRMDLIRSADGALLGAAFFYDGPENWEALKEGLSKVHGKGVRSGSVRLWLGEKAHVALEYHKPTGEGLLLMVARGFAVSAGEE